MQALPDPAVPAPPEPTHSSLGELGIICCKEQVATRDSVSYFLTEFYITLFTADPKRKYTELVGRIKMVLALSQERRQKMTKSSLKKPDPSQSQV